jgi:hypothetical protein
MPLASFASSVLQSNHEILTFSKSGRAGSRGAGGTAETPPKEGRELFLALVRKGFINARGEVTRLIGGEAEPEPDYENWFPSQGE